MKKILFLLTSAVVLFCSLPMISQAQTTGDFRNSLGGVNFTTATGWERYNGTAWVAAAAAPTSADGTIYIRFAEVTSNVTLDQVIVDGTLTVKNGVTLTLADGAGDDLFVKGILMCESTGRVAGAGKLVFGNQATLVTSHAGGVAGCITSTSPTFTAGMSYEFRGVAAQSTGFTGLTIGNPLNISFTNAVNPTTIDRNLTITGNLTIDLDVSVIMGAGVTSFTANTINNNGSLNNCVGATITPAFTNSAWASPKGIYQSSTTTEPTVEASNIWTNSHKTTAHIYWLASGSGNNRIVVLKAGSPVNVNAAIDNTNYTANTIFGSGTAIDGGFVVYNGVGSQLNVTGLIEGTTYHVAVFEYNKDCGTNRNYKTGSPLTSNFVAAERPCITEWITTDGTLTIPTASGTYNYNVSYRQVLPTTGTTTTITGITTANYTISGLNSGNTYEVSITGLFPGFDFGSSTIANQSKIRNIKQWGSIVWSSMTNAFGNSTNGCINLNSNATDVPNLNGVVVLSGMFQGCTIFNGGNIANWNTQNIFDTPGLFRGASSFNQPIGNWNTQKFSTINGMFSGATAFNQPINNWNMQNVLYMAGLFRNATSFNQPLNNWTLRSAGVLENMFRGATAFNQPLDSWNTKNIANIVSMFQDATAFNQSLAAWNVSGIFDNGSGLYRGAINMLDNCGMNTANYDATLTSWSAQSVAPGVTLGAVGRTYSCGAVAAARQNLITKGWTITGDISNCVDIVVSTTALPAFSTCLGIASIAQSYTVSASNLTANIVITAPTNFEVSITSATSGFAPTQTLIQSGGNVSNTTVYIRQAANAVSGVGGNITHTSTGVSTQNVLVPASIITSPTIIGVSTTSVSTSATSFLLNYTGTTNSPNQYSIVSAGTATPMPNFVPITNASLTASPLTITIPASATNNYTFNLTVTNTTTGCVSAVIPFTLQVGQPFITEWITTDGTIVIPTGFAGTFNYTVSYRQVLPTVGITTTLRGKTGECVISGLTNGNTYEVSITGQFPHIYFNGDPTNSPKIRNIKQWGTIVWASMQSAFGSAMTTYTGCSNLISNATDVPNLSNVTSLYETFAYCSVFNGGNVANWNTSNITNMMFTFAYASAFNQDISSWNTTNVTEMYEMFSSAVSFNQNISTWNTTNVIDMYGMFAGAKMFNQPIGIWNTQNCMNMQGMFAGATAFNQPIGAWNTTNVTNMSWMFRNTTAFNQPLSTWNTQNVTNLERMFLDATAFNQSLANWNVTNLNSGFIYGAYNMLDNCGMSPDNYDATLISWASQNVKTGVRLGAIGRKYCAGAAARQSLITNKGWTFTGDVSNCIAISTTTLPAFSTCLGTASIAQSYTVSASNLTANIVITAPTNFEVSITSATSGFAPTQTLIQSGGNVSNTTVYIRQAANAVSGVGGNITHTSTGVSTQNVLVPTSTITSPTIIGVSTIGVSTSATSFLLNYTGTTNSPNQYSIVSAGTATPMPNFVPITNASLTASPLTITIPASATNNYTFNLTVTNTTTGCVSAVIPFTLQVQQPFITEWITTDGTITIPTFTGLPTETYNYTVSYRELPTGMPTILTGQTGNVTLNSLTNGSTYEISITGTFPRIHFGGSTNANAAKIRNIKQWGSIRWTSMQQAFGRSTSPDIGCANLNSNATDVPDLSNVTSLKDMFTRCSVFNGGNISNWNTANITDMSYMFELATSFNQNIGIWNTANVTNMSWMFSVATAFNQNIGSWNTQNVTDMSGMFNRTTSFNQPIGSWNTANVIDMQLMFSEATAFNQPIGTWNTQSMTRMGYMFYGATAFNQPLNGWITINITNMLSMFQNATNFNQSLANWNVTKLNPSFPFGAYYMLDNCGMSPDNYDATLIGWASQNVKTGVQLGAIGRKYCAGAAARQSLITNKGWIFTGDVSNCINIVVSTTTLPAFSTCLGTASIAQSYTVSASNLTANIVITAPTNFEVSVTSATSGFAPTQTLIQSGGNVANTTVYIRQAATAVSGVGGNITHTSTGAITRNAAVTGTVNALPTITGVSAANVTTAATTFNLVYTGTTGTPNEYSITTGATAMLNFVAVTNATLGASPLAITIPASAAGTYNFNLTVRNSTTGCVSVVPFTLTVTGATVPATALNFDGTDDHVVLANESTFDLATTLTIETRVFTPAVLPGAVQSIINKRNDSKANFGINFSNSFLYFYFNDGNYRLTSLSPSIIPLNQWVHFAYTLEQQGADVRAIAYINGVQVGTNLWVGVSLTNAQNNDPVRLGTVLGNDEFFQGNMDEVRIWNVVKSASELLAKKDCELTGSEPNLLAYYNFNQGDGGAANPTVTALNDAAGTNDVGTLTNFTRTGATSNWITSTVLTACSIPAATATALNFDGTNDHVVLANESTFDLATTLTIETRVFTPAVLPGAVQSIINKRNDSKANFGINFSNSFLYFYFNDGNYRLTSLSPSIIPLNQWVHFAYTLEQQGANVRAIAYINGVQVGTNLWVGVSLTNAQNNEPVRLGTVLGNDEFFQGNMDEVRIWNVVKTQSELLAKKDCELTGSEPNLLAYYNFNQGDGGAANPTVTALNDAAGTNDVGTLTNFTRTGATSNWITSTVLTACSIPAATATALNFDGTNDHVVLANESTFDLATTLTIETRVFTPAVLPGAVQSIINKRNDSKANFGINFSNSFLYFYFNDGNYRLTSLNPNIIPLNQWVHFAYTLEQQGADVRAIAYINGVQVGTNLWVGVSLTNAQNNDPVRLGTVLGNDEFFQGNMDEVRIWNVVKSASELLAKKDCELTGSEPNLLAYYNFNQGDGGAANPTVTALNDAAGTNDVGTLTNFTRTGATSNWITSTVLTACSIPAATATALNFDGTNDHVVLANESTFDLATTLTIETRVFTPAVLPGAVQSIINKRNDSKANFGINFSNSFLYFYFNDGNYRLTSLSPSIIPLNQWVHFAYTLEQQGANVRAIAYINGVQVGTNLWVGVSLTNAQNNEPVRLGTVLGNDEFFQGNMDEVRIWNVVKTQSELLAKKDCELTGSEPNLLAYYNFNQGDGGAANPTVTALNDAAGTNDVGTLTNFTRTGATSNWITSTVLTACPSPASIASKKQDETLPAVANFGSALQVYPNPTDNKITVELGLDNSANVGIKLTDATGRMVFNETVSTNGLNFKHDIDMKDLASGVYMLLVNVEGKTTVKRIVKQ